MTEINAATPSPASPAQAIEAARWQLLKRARSSGSWFYWIAGLSVVNTLLSLGDTGRSFMVGLGSTQIIDAFVSIVLKDVSSSGAVTIIRGLSLLIDLLIIGLFVFFGFHAAKARGWAFYVGITLYALDALIFLLVGEWFSLIFHLFVLFQLFVGVQAMRGLKKLESAGTFSPA